MPSETQDSELELQQLAEDGVPALLTSLQQQTCSLCGGNVSEKACDCQHCGRPLARWRRWRDHLLSLWIAPLLIGALVFQWGQQSERVQVATQQAKDNNRLIRTLKMELSQNWAAINNVRGILTKDLDDLQHGQLSITPLLSFQSAAWEQAKYGRANLLDQAEEYLYRVHDWKVKGKIFSTHQGLVIDEQAQSVDGVIGSSLRSEDHEKSWTNQ